MAQPCDPSLAFCDYINYDSFRERIGGYCERAGNCEVYNMNKRVDRSEQGLRPWHVALGIVGVLVVTVVLWVVYLRSSTNRQLAALRAEGYPTGFAELAQQNRLPDGVRNAADIYVMAFDAFLKPADEANTLFVGKAKLPAPGIPLPEAVALATENCLAENQECLDLLAEAGTIEHRRYDWDYAQDMPYLSSIRCCAQLLASAVVMRGHQGDGTGALARFGDGLYLAQSLENEPQLLSYLVRIACTALAISSLERALSTVVFTDDQLNRIGQLVAEALASLDFTKAMINERCYMIEYFRNPFLLGSGGELRMLQVPGIGTLGLADMLDYMGNCVEAAQLPPSMRVPQFRALTDELNGLSSLHVVAKMLAPAMVRVNELDLRCRSVLDMAMVAVAIERYRLATGQVPENLEKLIPDYLDQVPIDPFDGQPIRYLRHDQGYRLYSVFEDGQDQGGKSKDEVGRGEPHDWPFIVVK